MYYYLRDEGVAYRQSRGAIRRSATQRRHTCGQVLCPGCAEAQRNVGGLQTAIAFVWNVLYIPISLSPYLPISPSPYIKLPLFYFYFGKIFLSPSVTILCLNIGLSILNSRTIIIPTNVLIMNGLFSSKYRHISILSNHSVQIIKIY